MTITLFGINTTVPPTDGSNNSNKQKGVSAKMVGILNV